MEKRKKEMLQRRDKCFMLAIYILWLKTCFSFQFCWNLQEVVIDQQDLLKPFWLQSSCTAITPLAVLLNSPPLTIWCNPCLRRLMISASLKSIKVLFMYHNVFVSNYNGGLKQQREVSYSMLLGWEKSNLEWYDELGRGWWKRGPSSNPSQIISPLSSL
jgi:hypothetical protein